MRSLVHCMLLAGLLLPQVSHAALRVKPQASVTFYAAGPAGLTIEGKTRVLKLKPSTDALVFEVPLKTLDTGIKLRNRHMLDKYLEAKKFPNARLEVPRAPLKMPAPGRKVSGKVSGKISIHGVTKPVRVEYTTRNDAGTYFVTGELNLNMRHFGIEVPSYLGITVKPQVKVKVQFTAVDP